MRVSEGWRIGKQTQLRGEGERSRGRTPLLLHEVSSIWMHPALLERSVCFFNTAASRWAAGDIFQPHFLIIFTDRWRAFLGHCNGLRYNIASVPRNPGAGSVPTHTSPFTD